MARNPDAPKRIDVLILASLSRSPKHGYDVKRDLLQNHVRWWAKAEHGHLYIALTRLESRKLIVHQKRPKIGRDKRVYAITAAGKQHLKRVLLEIGSSRDQTYYDVDLFYSAIFTLPRKKAIETLEGRAENLAQQLDEAKGLLQDMQNGVSPSSRLIMQHRIEHLRHEIAFTRRALRTYRLERAWAPR